MEDEDIRFATSFFCPAPCRTEVQLGSAGVVKCKVCSKEFDPREVVEMLLSQGRFFVVEECGSP